MNPCIELKSALCTLFRRGEDGKWKELNRKVAVHSSDAGLVIRVMSNNALLADIPLSTIALADYVSHNAIIIKFEGESFAIQFPTAADAQQCRTLLDRNGVQAPKRNGIAFPELQDPKVQDYVLKLLFSEEFKGFVNQLGDLLRGMQENIESGNKEDT